MVVDDDPDLLFTIEAIFKREEDIDLTTVESGEKCLEVMEEGFEGVILMDIMMPNMDGWDTIEEIVDRGYIEGVIIVMLTAKNKPGKKRQGLEEYVLDYIKKPFANKDLVGSVEEYYQYL